MHTAGCYIRLMQYCQEAGQTDVIDLTRLTSRLREQVRAGITYDLARWESDYVCRPSQFFNTRRSTFFPENREIAEYECAFIRKTQLDDGSWPIPWSWSDYPEQWAVSKNWWKAGGAVLNMLYLRGIEEDGD